MTTSSRPRRKKSLGQCFLEDRNILRLEADLADPGGRTILEIGAGDGRLTEIILSKSPKKLFAVEKDPHFASLLREKFHGKAEIIEGDFLEMKVPKVDVIVGNIPYYISSDIIFKLKDSDFSHAVLMVQKEFAQKMTANPGEKNYGRLSVTSQLSFNIKLERAVPKHLFRPVPEVHSAIITLSPTSFKPDTFQEDVIRSIFQHKNKTVRNALLDSKLFAKDDLGVLGAYEEKRGRELSKEQCLEIAGLLKNLKKLRALP